MIENFWEAEAYQFSHIFFKLSCHYKQILWRNKFCILLSEILQTPFHKTGFVHKSGDALYVENIRAYQYEIALI